MRSILTVCVGNICRSPLAAELLRTRIVADVTVASAGLDALVGAQADLIMQELLMERFGGDLSAHRGQQIARHLCVAADLILVMEKGHKAFLQNQYPFVRGKTYLLGEYGGFEISDPYRKERSVYEECFELVDRGVTDWVRQLNQLNGL